MLSDVQCNLSNMSLSDKLCAVQAKPPNILYEEPNSQMCSMDVDATSGRDVICGTDQECLVYLSQR